MTAANLTTILKGSVENSRKIGHDLVRAYGAGSRRMLHTVDRSFTKMLASPPVALKEPLRMRVKATGKKVVEFANGGVTATSATAVKAIDTMCDGGEALLGGIHTSFQQIDNPYATRAMGWLLGAGVPAAQLSRQITDQMAHSTGKLAVAAAGTKHRVATPRRRKAHAKKAQR